jgi:hypothetical protein
MGHKHRFPTKQHLPSIEFFYSSTKYNLSPSGKKSRFVSKVVADLFGEKFRAK